MRHDLRRSEWSFVPQKNPDGRLTVIRCGNYLGQIEAGDFIVVGTDGWSGRYRVRSLSKIGDHSVVIQAEFSPRPFN